MVFICSLSCFFMCKQFRRSSTTHCCICKSFDCRESQTARWQAVVGVQQREIIFFDCALLVFFATSYYHRLIVTKNKQWSVYGQAKVGQGLQLCRVLSRLSSLQKHLSIHTQVTPMFLHFYFVFFYSFFPPPFSFLPFFRFLFSLPGCKAETGETNSEQGPSIIGDVQAAKDGGGSSRITSTAV